MIRYKNLGSNSGVHSFKIGSDWIIITFSTNATYDYTYNSAGSNNIENMKNLARNGEGLNSYINKYVKYKYSRKL